MHAQNGRKLFWESGTHFHLRSRPPSQQIEFRNKFVYRLICSTKLRKLHHLSINRFRRFRGEIISQNSQNPHDSVLVIQMVGIPGGGPNSYARPTLKLCSQGPCRLRASISGPVVHNPETRRLYRQKRELFPLEIITFTHAHSLHGRYTCRLAQQFRKIPNANFQKLRPKTDGTPTDLKNSAFRRYTFVEPCPTLTLSFLNARRNSQPTREHKTKQGFSPEKRFWFTLQGGLSRKTHIPKKVKPTSAGAGLQKRERLLPRTSAPEPKAKICSLLKSRARLPLFSAAPNV